MNHQRIRLAVGVAALALAAAAVPAWAAVDREAMLTASAPKFEWTSSPGNAVGAPGPAIVQVSGCDAGPDHDCDYTLLRVEQEGTLLVTATPDEPTDVDLYVYRSDKSGKPGAELGSSSQILDAPEEVSAAVKPGYYLVEGSFYTAAQGTFTGSAKLTPKAAPVDVPPVTGGGTTTTPAPAADATPTASFGKTPKKAKKGKLKAFKGSATDDKGVSRVEFGLLQIKGDRCKQLTSTGRFVAAVKCAEPTVFINAGGTSKWSIKLKKGLPAGKYVAFVRAVDSAGQTQAGFPAAAKRTITVK
jgi:hypothetical protein